MLLAKGLDDRGAPGSHALRDLDPRKQTPALSRASAVRALDEDRPHWRIRRAREPPVAPRLDPEGIAAPVGPARFERDDAPIRGDQLHRGVVLDLEAIDPRRHARHDLDDLAREMPNEIENVDSVVHERAAAHDAAVGDPGSRELG